MGTLHYAGRQFEFEDRLLTHLHIVVVQKLTRSEGFTMSWIKPVSIGSGRSSIWLDRSIPVHFDFEGSRTPSINRDWLRILRTSADSPTGLIVVNEDGTLAHGGSLRARRAA